MKSSNDKDVVRSIVKASTTRSVSSLLSIELKKILNVLRSAVTKEYGYSHHHVSQYMFSIVLLNSVLVSSSQEFICPSRLKTEKFE